MSSFRTDLFSGLGSVITSNVEFVGDAVELTLFADIDSATTFRVQGSNATGFRTAIDEDDWSTLTTVAIATTNQMLNIEPGFRWLRVLRETASTASLAAVMLSMRNDNGGFR